MNDFPVLLENLHIPVPQGFVSFGPVADGPHCTAAVVNRSAWTYDPPRTVQNVEKKVGDLAIAESFYKLELEPHKSDLLCTLT
jgi:hypothetical protein